MEVHPEINDPVVLRVDDDRDYPSRVERLAEGLVVVEEPRDLPADETFGNGREVSVTWADADNDIWALPTKIMAAHPQGTLQVWSLMVTGPAAIAQRRRFERVPADGPATLRPADGKKSDAVPATLVDVSEAAIRCSVETGSADRFLGDRNEVVAEFRFGTADFAIPGRVEFARGTKRPMELEEVVVVFDDPNPDTVALRKQVFAEEARMPEDDDS